MPYITRKYHLSLPPPLIPVLVVNLKFTLEKAVKVERGGKRYSSTLSLTSALDGGGWSTPRPGRFIPGKQTR